MRVYSEIVAKPTNLCDICGQGKEVVATAQPSRAVVKLTVPYSNTLFFFFDCRTQMTDTHPVMQ